jgi:hypothetical protein
LPISIKSTPSATDLVAKLLAGVRDEPFGTLKVALRPDRPSREEHEAAIWIA